MAQTKTKIGRMQVAHPDLGYDTGDGGVNLHADLNTMFKRFSDAAQPHYDAFPSESDMAVSSFDSDISVPSTWDCRNLCWSPELGLLVVSGDFFHVSKDGKEWVSIPISVLGTSWNCVCWSPSLKIFTALSTQGTSASSTDGYNWTCNTTYLTPLTSGGWNDICWSETLKMFVAVGNVGVGNRVAISYDGVSWKNVTSAADSNWRSVCWSESLGIFVAVASSGSTYRVMTSPDGITWTGRTSSLSYSLTDVCWSEDIRMFVAVSTNGQTLISYDGITWDLGSVIGDCQRVCWSPELHLFCSPASTTNAIYTSPDGITWTTRTRKYNPGSTTWTSIIWAAELGIFCIGGTFPQSGSAVCVSKDIRSIANRSIPRSIEFSKYEFLLGSLFDTVGLTSSAWSVFSSEIPLGSLPRNRIFYGGWDKISYSDDEGRTFTTASGTSMTMEIYDFAVSPSVSNRIVAVCRSNDDQLHQGIVYSNSGASWFVPTTPIPISVLSPNLRGVVWGGGTAQKYVAVGSNTTYPILYSSDGTIWNSATPPSGNTQWKSICWSEPLDMFIAVGSSGTTYNVMTSTDGVTWTGVTIFSNAALTSIMWDTHTGMFLCLGSSTLYFSKSGVNWSKISFPVSVPSGRIQRNKSLGILWYSSSSGACYSYDGINWFIVPNVSTANTPVPVMYEDKILLLAYNGYAQWISVKKQGGRLFRGNSLSGGLSGDTFFSETNLSFYKNDQGFWKKLTKKIGGASVATRAVSTWTARTSAADLSWSSICWSPSLGLFCAVAWSGTGNRVMTSPDGITWTSRTSAADNNWQEVCWSPELGLFAAVASSGTNRVMTSPDGITWTIRTPETDRSWTSVCWSSELGIFVAITDSGATEVLVSKDGITWTNLRVNQYVSWNSVCWSPELGIFCAVGSSGVIMISKDGYSWSNIVGQTVSTTFTSVCWSPELGIFCAVSQSASNHVYTSPDGLIWTLAIGTSDRAWNSVCWSPELGIFVAVGSYATGTDRIMTSTDGKSWTLRTAPAANYYRSICWSPELGLFASVNDTATGTRVMTSTFVGKRLY